MNPTSIVTIVSCPDYEPARVLEAVRRGFAGMDIQALLGDVIAQGKAVLLKPNLLLPAAAEKGVTTHPSVFSAVAQALREKGARLTFGDSPNGVFTPEAAARKSGLLEAAAALSIPMADFDTGEEVHFPGGVQNKRFTVARSVREAGAIINLPRLKTHSLTGMTGALKNMFGVVPGSLKAEFHIRHPDAESFSRMIADLNALVPSRLIVMDGIMGMEGNGPGSGTLVPVGLLLFSDDPVAIDAVACRIMGIDPMSVAVIRFAQEMGLGNARASAIELRGDNLQALMPRAFKMPARSPQEGVPKWAMRMAKDLIVPKPVIDAKACIKCGDCVAACPTTPKSLRQSRGAVPVYDYSTCIRCYCCQETCRQGAISLRKAPLSRFFAGKQKARTV
jgi:uncharacterized protein (DUF362 family)/Pyruvate/2-oxoacid:ferredoxin oxidoreductase delta subunit